MSNDDIKTIGVIGVTSHLLSRACEKLKSTKYYHHRSKYLVNSLLGHIQPFINAENNIKALMTVDDSEDIDEEGKVRIECVELFVDLIYQSNFTETHNLLIALANLKNRKKVFTEEEIYYKNIRQ